MVIHWLIFPYPSSLLHWHRGNLTIAPVPAKQPRWIWINTSCEFIMNDCITTTKQSTTKPCAYFLGYTVHVVMGASSLRCRMGMDLIENKNDLWYLLRFWNEWKYYDFVCCLFPVAFAMQTKTIKKSKQAIKTKHVKTYIWQNIGLLIISIHLVISRWNT